MLAPSIVSVLDAIADWRTRAAAEVEGALLAIQEEERAEAMRLWHRPHDDALGAGLEPHLRAAAIAPEPLPAPWAGVGVVVSVDPPEGRPEALLIILPVPWAAYAEAVGRDEDLCTLLAYRMVAAVQVLLIEVGAPGALVRRRRGRPRAPGRGGRGVRRVAHAGPAAGGRAMRFGLDALRPWSAVRVAEALDLQPFEVIRILATDGTLPRDLRLRPEDAARVAEAGGLESWWDGGAHPIPGPLLLRSLARHLLDRAVIEPRWTRADNLFRGLEPQEQGVVRHAVNVWLRSGGDGQQDVPPSDGAHRAGVGRGRSFGACRGWDGRLLRTPGGRMSEGERSRLFGRPGELLMDEMAPPSPPLRTDAPGLEPFDPVVDGPDLSLTEFDSPKEDPRSSDPLPVYVEAPSGPRHQAPPAYDISPGMLMTDAIGELEDAFGRRPSAPRVERTEPPGLRVGLSVRTNSTAVAPLRTGTPSAFDRQNAEPTSPGQRALGDVPSLVAHDSVRAPDLAPDLASVRPTRRQLLTIATVALLLAGAWGAWWWERSNPGAFVEVVPPIVVGALVEAGVSVDAPAPPVEAPAAVLPAPAAPAILAPVAKAADIEERRGAFQTATGSLQVLCNRKASIYVDNVRKGSTADGTPLELTAGMHRVKVVANGRTRTMDVRIDAGRSRQVQFELR